MKNTQIKRRIKGMMFKLPMMISCEEFEEFIVEYLEGSLSPRQRSVFELHIKICRECREFLAAYQTSIESAKLELNNDQFIGDVPEDLITAILDSRGKK